MITTPSMGLKRWDQPNDIFSYTELSDNFNLLDLHDHSSGKGVQIPTNGLANLAVTDTKLANNAVTDSKVASATLTDAKLASPNNFIYRTVLQGASYFGGGAAATTWLFSSTSAVPSGNTTSNAICFVPWTAAHYSVSSKTTRMRVLVAGGTNTAAPGITFNFGLFPITAVGGSVGLISYTAGTAVPGSTAAVITPAASSRHMAVSSDFTPPADGVYALGTTLSASTAGSSWSAWTVMLQIRHV